MASDQDGAIEKACGLFKLLAPNHVHGLSPSEIAKALGVSPSWVSINLARIQETGFVERIEETGRWRLGVALVQISVNVVADMDKARGRLDELQQRYTRNS